VKMFDAGKTRMIGLTYGEKAMTIRGGATVLKVGGNFASGASQKMF